MLAGAGVSLLIGVAVGQVLRAAFGVRRRLDGGRNALRRMRRLFARSIFAFPRLFGDGRKELTYAEGSYALRGSDGTFVHAADGGIIDARGRIERGAVSEAKGAALVYRDDPLRVEYRRDPSVTYATPEGTAVYAKRRDSKRERRREGQLVETLARSFHRRAGIAGQLEVVRCDGFRREFRRNRLRLAATLFRALGPALWGNPRGFRLDAALATIVFISATVYALVWVPDVARHSPDPGEVHNLNDVVYRQYSMYEYHHNLVATHPYSSRWFEWPMDYVPIAYFYQDRRKDPSNSNGCCIYEITSLPNPVILWFGLLCVPWVAVLAWRERNKAYALIVLTYLLQWLPWIGSPRLTFAYHFYVEYPADLHLQRHRAAASLAVGPAP